jgi:hypothetical protein
MSGTRRTAFAILALLLAVAPLARSHPAKGKTLPVRFDHNRMLVEVEFQRRDGSWRRAVAWVDTGNPQLALGQTLAEELGVEWAADPSAKPDGKVEASAPAGMRFGPLALPLEGVSCAVFPGRAEPFPGVPAEANLPSTILRRFDVCFDYPRRRMTLAEAGGLRFEGAKVPCLLDPRSGIVQMEVRVGGETLSFALDNGASYTLVDADWVGRLREKYPGWPYHAGLVGCANLWGMPVETELPMMRLEEMSIGPVVVEGAGAAGFPEGLFEWYSKKTAGPVAGLLGPNVLKAFRVGIDFRGAAVYLDRGRKDDTQDMDLVGLTLRASRDGSYEILGAGPATGAKAGDLLLRVGSLEVKGRSMGEVVDALRGRPGRERRLTVRRGTETLTLKARVERQM